MRQLLDLYQHILTHGQREPNRTGIDTLTIPGAMLKFDLRDGFPAVTTKQLFFRKVKAELIGFLRGCTSAAEFRELGCDVWDKNANEHNVDMQGNFVENKWLANPARTGRDDLGRIYSAQWRDWEGCNMHGDRISIDQIDVALNQVRSDPESRRIVVNAWNPADLDQTALPWCHTGFQLLPRSDGTLHMTMTMRSADMFLGVPFNIASYALLLELFAAWTGRTAATLTMFLSDAHIYVNHIDQVKEQMSREPLHLPKLQLRMPICVEDLKLDSILSVLSPDDVWLEGYEHHPAIRGMMAG